VVVETSLRRSLDQWVRTLSPHPAGPDLLLASASPRTCMAGIPCFFIKQLECAEVRRQRDAMKSKRWCLETHDDVMFVDGKNQFESCAGYGVQECGEA